ncbi:MAG: response regulator [Acidobacteriia bacterium]|nr:response regulator [Terriglobia bacterium]
MKKVLIIEDDLVIAAIYSNKIELGGYQVDVALDGEEGMNKLDSFKPDLVQLDLILPKIPGLEIIKSIRSKPELKSLPIVVVSNGYDGDMFREAREAGANQCVSKLSCSPKVILDIINQLLTPPATAAVQHTPSATSAAAAVHAVAAAQPLDIDAALPSEIRRQFADRSPQIQGDLKDRLQAVLKSADSARLVLLEDLSQHIHFLAGFAGITGFHRISHLASAFEVMLQELREKPREVTFSTLGTIANTVDCLVRLLGEAPYAQLEFPSSTLILAVDDEPISRRTLCTALSKAYLKAVSVEDPEVALKLLVENRFDLIFLDVDMPGITGFELCQELRSMPINKETPVVFVTVLSDFQSRAQSNLSGGNDLIAKPYLLSELAVKALTFLVQIKPR